MILKYGKAYDYITVATEILNPVVYGGTDATRGRDLWGGVYGSLYTAYQLDELRESEAQLDQNGVGVVADRSDETVVITEQVVVQSFGVRVAQTPDGRQQQQRQRRRQLNATPAVASSPEFFDAAAVIVIVVAVVTVASDGVDRRHRVFLGGGRLNR